MEAIRKLLASLCILLLLSACSEQQANKNTTAGADAAPPARITLAVVPYISAPHLYDAFTPFANALSEKLQIQVVIKTAESFDKFTRQTLQQRYDLVVSNPYIYLQLNKQGGYEAIVADSNPFRTVFVVADDSPIRALEQLKGKRIGVLPPAALAGHLLPVDFLLQQGFDIDKDVELVQHESFNLVLTSLLNGKIDAGCFWLPQYNDFSETTKNSTRIVATTEQIVNDPYAIRGDMPAQLKHRIRQALLELNQASHQELLKKIGIKSFIAASDADYDKMRDFARRNNLEF